MYCNGSEEGVREWVSTVHRLRYKDYQLMARPSPFPIGAGPAPKSDRWQPGLNEVATVKEFATIMEQNGILEWWRKAMAFV
ncbi:hypothetical protein GQ53DRAFT_749843 [Thozetella sp. PMI_491]|nr:hypothetical protein GQ53DRAFT_749843 [Thozetella sp. PMI_491]